MRQGVVRDLVEATRLARACLRLREYGLRAGGLLSSSLWFLLAWAALVGALSPGVAESYPLDEYGDTGIKRLEGLRRAVRTTPDAWVVSPGGEMPSSKVELSLADRPDFRVPPADRTFSAELSQILGQDARGWSLAVLDLTYPDRPRFGVVNPDAHMNAGSAGKIVTALALLTAVGDVYPDPEDRERVLRETVVVADEFIRNDTHEVPWWEPDEKLVARRPIEEGDQGNLYQYLDWSLSNSSSAAAAIVQREALLLRRFGRAYPVDPATADAWLDRTSKGELGRELAAANREPLARSGISRDRLQQGSLFTREGKKRLPGQSSWATGRGLIDYLVAMEKGQLVDLWTSLEMKRLLYVTDKRVRWAGAAELREAAVFFKSGSLFRCGGRGPCGDYAGNTWNFLAAVADVQMPQRDPPIHYLVGAISNVLGQYSIPEHDRVGGAVQILMERLHPELGQRARMASVRDP